MGLQTGARYPQGRADTLLRPRDPRRSVKDMKTLIAIFLCVTCMSCAHTDIRMASPAKPRPRSLEALLDALLQDIITGGGEDRDRSKSFYGTPGDRELILVNT